MSSVVAHAVADRSELDLEALGFWFDFTCPRCAGPVVEVARSGVHEAGRRCTTIVKCTSSSSTSPGRCGRSWQLVLEVQECHYSPAAADRVVRL